MCKYAKIKVERPSSGAMRYMVHCDKYKRYCLNTKDCKEERDMKCQQLEQS